MQNKISLFWAKIQLHVIRFLPMIIALVYLLNTIFAYLDINTIALSMIGGMAFLPLVFLYISSYAFRFCNYHRMFLHYIAAADCINWLDHVVKIPITDLQYFILLVLLFGITCFIALFMFINRK